MATSKSFTMTSTLSRQQLLRAGLGAGIMLASPRAMLAANLPEAPASARKRVVFAWLVPHDAASFASFQQHANVITHVSPTWYTMDKDQSITGQADPAVVAFARQRGIALVPLIKNKQFSPTVAHDILANSTRRAKAATNIADLVSANGYDGINIDFEGPFGESRARLSDFMTRLSALLRPRSKLLTVNVVPQLKPASQYSSTSWAAPYDYTVLGQVCDQVMVMCYAYSGSTPGSLSPLWWLQDATTYALGQVPALKLVVGMSFYGRHWITKDAKVTHTDLKQAQAVALLAQSGAKLERPARDMTPRFTWTDAAGDHVVHYEDAKSLAAKLAVVRAAGVAGATFWRLGQEEATQWKVIKQGLR
jgi:spore germination protein